MSKHSALLFISVLALSSLITVESAYAQSITKPSIPEFTAQYVDNSYEIAPTYTIDPYTNNTVTQTYGSHVDNRTVVITIKNEPFTPFTDGDGNTINVFYNVRFKGTFGQDWTRVYGVERTVWYDFDSPDDNYGYRIQNYASQNTVVVIASPALEGRMDIQVEALRGYTDRTTVQGHIFMAVVAYAFYGEESGWSDTQTITLGEASTYTPDPTSPTTASPNSTDNSTTSSADGNQLKTLDSIPLTTLVLVVIILIAIIAALSVLALRRHRKTSSSVLAL